MPLFQDKIIRGHGNFWFQKKKSPVPYCHSYCTVPNAISTQGELVLKPNLREGVKSLCDSNQLVEAWKRMIYFTSISMTHIISYVKKFKNINARVKKVLACQPDFRGPRPRLGYPWYKSSCHLENTISWLVGMNSAGGTLMDVIIDFVQNSAGGNSTYIRGIPALVGDPWNQVAQPPKPVWKIS